MLRPHAEDVFIFKPRHSGFYATPLAEALGMKEVGELVLTE